MVSTNVQGITDITNSQEASAMLEAFAAEEGNQLYDMLLLEAETLADNGMAEDKDAIVESLGKLIVNLSLLIRLNKFTPEQIQESLAKAVTLVSQELSASEE